ncbi:unnamed protein product [Brassica oleracea]
MVLDCNFVLVLEPSSPNLPNKRLSHKRSHNFEISVSLKIILKSTEKD